MSFMRRPENVPLHPYTLRFRSWKKQNSRTAAVLHYVCAFSFTLLFAYRLLLVSRWWGQSPFSGQLAQGNHLLPFVEGGSAWLPPAWVGQPPPVDPLACTPQLLIIGAMKGGTTALFHHLNGSEPATRYLNGSKSHVDYKPRFHPGIIGAHVTKELHFFDKQPNYTLALEKQQMYFASFPGVDATTDDPLAGQCSYPAQLGLSSSSSPGLIRMEATSMYLAHPKAAGNIKNLLPQMRLVALLREPVSRALSSVNMLFQRSLHFADLKEHTWEYNQAWQAYVVSELRGQLHTVSRCLAKVQLGTPAYLQMDKCVFRPTGKLSGVLHIHVGLYALHLERWFSHFAPDQLLLWASTAFEEKPKEHMEQLVNWLGLDPTLIHAQASDFKKVHERSYPTALLPKALFQELVAFFQPHNQRLFTLLENHGYGALVLQLKKAWDIELHETISTLQKMQPDESPLAMALQEAEVP